MANLPTARTVLPPYKVGQTIGGKPVYSPVQLGPEYVPTASFYPQGFRPQNSYIAWIMRVAEGIASNILHNWQYAGGKPGGWDESKYGSWAALVSRNAGGSEMNAGDMNAITSFLMNEYVPSPGDWYQTNFGAAPTPSPTEWVLDPTYITLAIAEEQNRDKSELERMFKIYQAEAEIIAARQKASSSGSSGRSGGYYSYSRGGGGGGGAVDVGVSPDMQAKLDMDWKIALLQMEGDLAKMELQERLTLWDIESRERMQQAELQYMRERDLQNTWTERGALVARTMANPNDALQREYMLRMYNNLVEGQEPKGAAIDIFSGQQMNNGQPTSFTEIQTQNANAWGMNPLIPGNPPIGTAPVPGPSTNPYPPSGYASGTTGRIPTLNDLLSRVMSRFNQTATSNSADQPVQDLRNDPRYAWYYRQMAENSWRKRLVEGRPSLKGWDPIKAQREAAKANRNNEYPPYGPQYGPREHFDPMVETMKWAMKPGFASGTQNSSGDFSYTREKFFIVGDSENGAPTGNEELIINHDQGRVTVIPNKFLSSALNAIANGRVKYAS